MKPVALAGKVQHVRVGLSNQQLARHLTARLYKACLDE